jgi:hypothetical protein
MTVWLNRSTWETDRCLEFEGKLDQMAFEIFLADEGINLPPGRKWGPINSYWIMPVISNRCELWSDHVEKFRFEARDGKEIMRVNGSRPVRPGEQGAKEVTIVRQVPAPDYESGSFRGSS